MARPAAVGGGLSAGAVPGGRIAGGRVPPGGAPGSNAQGGPSPGQALAADLARAGVQAPPPRLVQVGEGERILVRRGHVPIVPPRPTFMPYGYGRPMPTEPYAITIPFDGVPLPEQRAWYEECAELGYTDLWSAEAGGADAFVPLALASTWVPGVRLGTSIVPAFTRGPALMAQSVATLAAAAPGRFVFGIGTSTPAIVTRWNAVAFEEPYKHTRDMVRFLKLALTGEKVDRAFDTFEVKGFRLGIVPPEIPPILVAALRPGMLHMAAREAEGAIINWLSADDVTKVAAEIGPGKEVVARIFVCPNDDPEVVRSSARFAIAAYLTVPVYAAFHDWLGRGPRLAAMSEAWAAGDRKAAVAAIPDDVVDELVVWGTPDACRAHIARYVANGVTTPCLAVLPFGMDLRQAVRSLAPGG